VYFFLTSVFNLSSVLIVVFVFITDGQFDTVIVVSYKSPVKPNRGFNSQHENNVKVQIHRTSYIPKITHDKI